MKIKQNMRVVAFLTVLMISLTSYAAGNYFDISDSSKGVLHVSYKGNANKRVKLMIEKEKKKYTYDVSTTGKKESFPFQLGNGTYKITLLENVGGKSYRIVETENVKVEVDDLNKVFLNSIQNIDWNTDSKAIKKAVELTKETKDLGEKAKMLYGHIVQGYSYDYNKLAKLPSTYLPIIDQTFKDKSGICYDFSSLYGAMLRSQGIPAKLVKGYSPNAEGYHAWNEVYDSEKKEWLIIDSTYDLQVIKKKIKVKMIKSEKDYQKVNEY